MHTVPLFREWPMLRLVGLWQQFQQANLSVQRLGDIMNALAEPYSIVPTRLREGKGQIDIEGLSFRYAENLPFLYQDFSRVGWAPRAHAEKRMLINHCLFYDCGTNGMAVYDEMVGNAALFAHPTEMPDDFRLMVR